jgi:hypothetical protein
VISTRVISMSYPWIGLPMEMFRANNQSSVPFILSHITRYIRLCLLMLCHIKLCYVMLCYVMLCYVMLCYVMLCYVLLCHLKLCYGMIK